jgi:hypothetical protein
MGDAYGAAIIEATSRKELDKLPMISEKSDREADGNQSTEATSS